jgi:hypothetical protein
VQQLEQNLGARAVGADVVAGLEQELAAAAEDPEQYWAARSRLAWT